MTTYLHTVFDEKESKIPPIVPVSASFDVNVDVVCEYLSRLKVPSSRKLNEQFKMIVIRSFDINKPGIDVTKLNGGVIGGTILRGSLNVGDNINIYPGIYKKIHESKKQKEGPDFEYSPLMGKVISIKSEQNELKTAIPGGLLGIQLTIDPAFSRNDHLSGSIAIKTDLDNKELKVYDKIIINMTTFSYDHDKTKSILKKTQELSINVNSNNVECKVMKYSSKSKELYLFLDRPIAIDNVDNLATVILKNANKDILGRGKIIDGVECDLMI
jgi:translation initiation factor 2 subunit 3